MLNLPYFVQEEIVGYLPKEDRRLCVVSRRWKRVIEKKIGLKFDCSLQHMETSHYSKRFINRAVFSHKKHLLIIKTLTNLEEVSFSQRGETFHLESLDFRSLYLPKLQRFYMCCSPSHVANLNLGQMTKSVTSFSLRFILNEDADFQFGLYLPKLKLLDIHILKSDLILKQNYPFLTKIKLSYETSNRNNFYFPSVNSLKELELNVFSDPFSYNNDCTVNLPKSDDVPNLNSFTIYIANSIPVYIITPGPRYKKLQNLNLHGRVTSSDKLLASSPTCQKLEFDFNLFIGFKRFLSSSISMLTLYREIGCSSQRTLPRVLISPSPEYIMTNIVSLSVHESLVDWVLFGFPNLKSLNLTATHTLVTDFMIDIVSAQTIHLATLTWVFVERNAKLESITKILDAASNIKALISPAPDVFKEIINAKYPKVDLLSGIRFEHRL